MAAVMTDGMIDLLGPLLDGAFEDPAWQTFLDRLRAITRSTYVSLIFRQTAPNAPSFSLVHLYSGAAWSPDLERQYREGLHRRDPTAYRQLEEGRLYRDDELLIRDDPRHQAYRREILVPNHTSIFRLLRVAEPGGVNVWLNVSRADADYSAEQDAMIGALTPYLRTALRFYAELERERFNASVATEAIRRLNFGWFALDAQGCIVDSDAQGDQFLGQSGVLRRGANGRLTGVTPALDREISGAVRALTERAGGRPRALVLQRDPWVDMLLVPAHRRSLGPGASPAILAYVHGDSWSSADRCEQLADLFELLPSEARLALALGRGMTITEAATDLGLTVETARNYSKKIYAKTGARGQPDLVRFIHRSVLAIA